MVPFLPNGTTLNSPYFRISNASLLITTSEAALWSISVSIFLVPFFPVLQIINTSKMNVLGSVYLLSRFLTCASHSPNRSMEMSLIESFRRTRDSFTSSFSGINCVGFWSANQCNNNVIHNISWVTYMEHIKQYDKLLYRPYICRAKLQQWADLCHIDLAGDLWYASKTYVANTCTLLCHANLC